MTIDDPSESIIKLYNETAMKNVFRGQSLKFKILFVVLPGLLYSGSTFILISNIMKEYDNKLFLLSTVLMITSFFIIRYKFKELLLKNYNSNRKYSSRSFYYYFCENLYELNLKRSVIIRARNIIGEDIKFVEDGSLKKMYLKVFYMILLPAYYMYFSNNPNIEFLFWVTFLSLVLPVPLQVLSSCFTIKHDRKKVIYYYLNRYLEEFKDENITN